MVEIKMNKKAQGGLSAFLGRQYWFVSAGLVLFIYGVVWYYLWTYWSAWVLPEDVSPLALFLSNVIHVLPALAVALAAFGFIERRRREAEDRERKRKRYEARMEISRFKRGSGPGS